MFPLIELITFSGSDAHKWVPFARKQAWFMAEFKTRPAKFLRMSDGTEIRIRVNEDGEAFIHIASAGEGGLYQFWGAEGYLYKDVLDTYYSYTRYMPRGHGVMVALKKGALAAQALGSNLLQAPNDEWAYAESPIDTDTFMSVTPFHQPDGLGISYRYRRPGESTKTYALSGSTWAPSHPCHSFGILGSGGKCATYLTDIWYDYPAILYRAKTGDKMGPPVNFW